MISLNVLILQICLNVVNPGKETCEQYMNKCVVEKAKEAWAQEYIPEVRKVKVFLHCAYFEGWGKK